MSDSDNEILQILTDAFYGYSEEMKDRVTPEMRFAHYTSAETALSIINAHGDDRALWLRNATEMNDFSEVEYGLSCLKNTLSRFDVTARLIAIASSLNMNLNKDFVEYLGKEHQSIKSDTYLLSLAEHKFEDHLGVLSMWRAYGGRSNVCIVMNTAPFLTPQNAYDVDITAVDYRGEQGFLERFLKVLSDMESNAKRLKNLEAGLISLNWRSVIADMVLSTKHPGFAEEKEWRLIHRKKEFTITPAPPSKVVCVNGVVQTVHYLPLKNVPELGVVGANLDQLLCRLIIGPTENPHLVRNAFIRALGEAGVGNPEHRVFMSPIPLRR